MERPKVIVIQEASLDGKLAGHLIDHYCMGMIGGMLLELVVVQTF